MTRANSLHSRDSLGFPSAPTTRHSISTDSNPPHPPTPTHPPPPTRLCLQSHTRPYTGEQDDPTPHSTHPEEVGENGCGYLEAYVGQLWLWLG